MVFVIACLVIFSNRTLAQDANWRHDYAAARKEASETGKPLLMDFGTEACVWCRKLDATTFRDPRVVKLLNERFIPVKIDANREIRLTQALAIDSYPTIVLASAEGKILGRHVGYADYSELSTLLAKAPPRQDTKPNSPPPSPQGNAVVAQARADFEARKYAECLRQCNLVIAALPASPEAHEARQLSQQIALDPVATRLVKDQINSGLTSLQTKLAAALDR
jgi:thioredoxin-like negative regulator of GroEL